MSDLTFAVSGESNSPTQFKAKARQFELIIDEPTDLGGTDKDANPVEYILAGLAGCINVIGHLIAKELDFTIEKLHIEVKGDINPDKFLGLSTADRAGFKAIELELTPETDAPEHILEKWVKLVEERCPVKDNLANYTPIKVKTIKQAIA